MKHLPILLLLLCAAACTAPQPAITIPTECHVHDTQLKRTGVRTISGIGSSDWDYGTSERRLFPFSDKPNVEGCIAPDDPSIRYVCEHCAAARRAWVLDEKVRLGIYKKTAQGTYIQIGQDDH